MIININRTCTVFVIIYHHDIFFNYSEYPTKDNWNYNFNNAEYKKSGKGLKIMQIAGGYQILSDTQYHVYLERLFHKKRKIQLSRPAMEALSIIAYRHPVSKSEIESIRGVECGSVVGTLMERELITVKGRSNTVGRPLLFGTTQIFLESFGLEKISDLPKLKELSDLMSDNQDPDLFLQDHALK